MADGDEIFADSTQRAQTAQLGFGCARLLTHTDRRKAVELLELALDEGITHIDVARSYGDGRTEGVIGEVAKRRRTHMTIVTKAGLFPPSFLSRARRKAHALAGRICRADASRSFAPQAIRRSVHQSLRCLRTDYLDGFLLHGCCGGDISDDLRATLAGLKCAGIVRRVGMAGEAAEVSAIAARFPDLADVLQVPATQIDELKAPAGAQIITHSVFTRDRANDEPIINRLSGAMSRNASGVVLFSSSNPHHIRENAKLARFVGA